MLWKIILNGMLMCMMFLNCRGICCFFCFRRSCLMIFWILYYGDWCVNGLVWGSGRWVLFLMCWWIWVCWKCMENGWFDICWVMLYVVSFCDDLVLMFVWWCIDGGKDGVKNGEYVKVLWILWIVYNEFILCCVWWMGM